MQKEDVLHWIETLSTRCYRCTAAGLDNTHPGSDCSHPPDVLYQALIDKIRTTIRYDKYSGCYFCGMPQELCGSFVRTMNGMTKSREKRSCTYAGGLMEAAAIMISFTPRTRQKCNEFWRRRGVLPTEENDDSEGRKQEKIIIKLSKKIR